ncbi:MAG TPA: hypothetical protein VF753_10815 [Terriglobales bacterium]
MPNKKKGAKSSSQPPAKKRQPGQYPSPEQLEQDADEMAGKAQEVENKYDEDHDIFTK